jgi:hypothetical protein
MRLMIGPSQANLEQEKALALKALGCSGKTGYVYGPQQSPLAKPALNNPGAKPSQVDQLKRDLTGKAEAGNAKAQLALGKLCQFATLAPDGTARPDYAAAAYWYRLASDHGEAQAAYELAILYRDGLGVPANEPAALDLFRKAAQAGWLPAMVPLRVRIESLIDGICDCDGIDADLDNLTNQPCDVLLVGLPIRIVVGRVVLTDYPFESRTIAQLVSVCVCGYPFESEGLIYRDA